MSGICFGDVKTFRCSKAVINECRELALSSSSFRRIAVSQIARQPTLRPYDLRR